MDTSELYIKMCNCKEIQEGRRFPMQALISPRPNYIGNDVYVDINIASSNWKTLWLPRQDQIQEICFGPDASPMGMMIPDLMHYQNEIPVKYGYYYLQFMSMEQLWLAYFMFTAHKKIWDSEKWIEAEQ